MAHAKAVNRKKNYEDVVDSSRLVPIGGERHQVSQTLLKKQLFLID